MDGNVWLSAPHIGIKSTSFIEQNHCHRLLFFLILEIPTEPEPITIRVYLPAGFPLRLEQNVGLFRSHTHSDLPICKSAIHCY